MRVSGIFLLSAFVFGAASAWSQIDASPSSPDTALHPGDEALLSVRTVPSGAKVMLDTTMIGIAPVESAVVQPGRRVLRLLPPDPRSWFQEAVIETLSVEPGERIRRDAVFSPSASVASDPYGATVAYRDSILGVTPLRLALRGGTVSVQKPGYDSVDLSLPPGGGTVNVLLRPLSPGAPGPALPYLTSDESKSPLALYVASGAAIVGGVSAAYFKIKADGAYSDYLASGDQATLNRVHRLDLASGISLAACQISLGLLTYFLFTR